MSLEKECMPLSNMRDSIQSHAQTSSHICVEFNDRNFGLVLLLIAALKISMPSHQLPTGYPMTALE